MAFTSTNDRRVELAFVFAWSILLVWSLFDRATATAPAGWRDAAVIFPVGMLLASGSRFSERAAIRWSLLALAFIATGTGLVLVRR